MDTTHFSHKNSAFFSKKKQFQNDINLLRYRTWLPGRWSLFCSNRKIM